MPNSGAITNLKEETKSLREISLKYKKWIRNKLEAAQKARKGITEIEQKPNISDEDLWQLYNLECSAKYLNSNKGIFNLDIVKLDAVLTLIEKDKKVKFLDKLKLLMLIDLYYDIRILSFYINNIFPEKVKKKTANEVYFTLEKTINSRKRKNKKHLSFAEKLKLRKDKKYYKEILEFIETETAENSLTINETENIILDIAGMPMMFPQNIPDTGKLEKYLFPIFLETVYLHKDGNYTKMNLLFDILPIIKPDGGFVLEDEFNSRANEMRTYSRYRVDMFRQFSGAR